MAIGTRMLMTQHEIEEDWWNPPMMKENEEEADEDPVNECQNWVDKLIYAVG